MGLCHKRPNAFVGTAWDYHYGYYDHQLCHGFYPPFLFENGDIVEIPGNTHPDCGNHPGSESPENAAIRHDMTGKVTYSQDLFNDKIVDFLRQIDTTPSSLFHPSQLPHGPISVPEIHPGVKDAPELTGFEKEYASMILRLDDTVGIILDELDALGIADNTIVFFSSDNGHEIYAAQQGRTVKRQSLDGIRYDDITTRHTTEQSGDMYSTATTAWPASNGRAGKAAPVFPTSRAGPVTSLPAQPIT